MTVTADALARALRAGPVKLEPGSVISGDLRLHSKVANRLICQRCRFEGVVVAGTTFAGALDLRDSTFDGIVDLRNATIKGRLDLSRSSFSQPLLANSAQFKGAVDFSLARFSSLASFQDATFSRSARFGLATFGGDAVFERVTFEAAADKSAWGSVAFDRASFAQFADFNFFEASRPVLFRAAAFKGGTDFSGATFGTRVSFERARFDAGATFAAAEFSRSEGDQTNQDTFLGAKSASDLDFSFASIGAPIDFQTSVIRGTLSFGDSEFGSLFGDLRLGDPGSSEENTDWLNLHQMTVGALEMSVGDIESVNDTDRQRVLRLIESDAKARGDLGTANDAYYKSQQLKSQDRSLPLRVLDVVFYREVAGYLVRPFSPLRTLLVLAALMAIYRAASLASRARALGSVPKRALTSLPRCFIQTLLLIVPSRWLPQKQGDASAEDSELVQRSAALTQVEAFTYRVLVACALIGFANSNPTLRQMLDAIG